MDKIDGLFRIIGRYDHYIELANNKANYVLASIITVNVAMAALLGYSEVLKFEVGFPFVGIFKVLSLICYFAFLFFSGVAIKGVNSIIFPNTSSPVGVDPSNVFFGDVGGRSHVEYAHAFKEMSCDKFIEDLSFQANALAKIVSEKFNHQKDVMNTTVRQVVPFALATSSLCGLIKSLS
ncbi:hypothetical protein M2399_004666 [Pseudomonas sp. BIGb0450]|uniref:hypothetical protein n=1 Tax=unclassified Pseudomonas TaxID=196821 RepID=UPI0021696374|nr:MULTISPECIES: hypothetical protein [unclassified Pseudomonas]MCS3419639.1 hypothetical protein [Pseudomonas sp. BIGb0558]MCS3439207.1 hypothetical protein [Pseudomonas sp. BIGb0450]